MTSVRRGIAAVVIDEAGVAGPDVDGAAAASAAWIAARGVQVRTLPRAWWYAWRPHHWPSAQIASGTRWALCSCW